MSAQPSGSTSLIWPVPQRHKKVYSTHHQSTSSEQHDVIRARRTRQASRSSVCPETEDSETSSTEAECQRAPTATATTGHRHHRYHRTLLRRRFFRGLRYASLILTTLSAIGSVIAQEELSPECDQLFESTASSDSKKGTFETPGYPNPYPANLNCRYRFRAGDGEVVWVQWDKFHLREPLARNNQCLYDYVEIVVTDQQEHQHVSGRHCGNKTPPNLETMQQTLDIRFHSENSLSYSGFRATYLFLDEQQVPPPQSKYNKSTLPADFQEACGGITRSRYSGTIVSPGFPNTYPAHVECNWLIRVDRSKQIYVKLQDLQFSNTMQCNDAALYIIDGYKHSTVLAQGKDPASSVRLCGNILYQGTDGSHGYMSDQNRMIIKFVSRREPHASDYNELGMVGFRLTWTEVTVAEKAADCQSDEFLCNGGEYCIDEGGSVCTKGKQYCIHKSLVCNGVPNCAEHDDSDEENCFAIQIVIAGVLVVAFLVFVIFTVICCQRRRNQQQLHRMKQRHVQSHAAHNHQDSAMTHLSSSSVPNNPQQTADANDPRLANRHSPNHTPSSANRQTLDLRAMPANYHGYNLPSNQTAAQANTSHNIRQRRQAGTESDDDEHRPFLVNHVSQPAPVPSQAMSHSQSGYAGGARKPLRVPVPPDVEEPTSHGFIQVHQTQRSVVPVEDVLFDDQLRLTTSGAPRRGETPPTRFTTATTTTPSHGHGHSMDNNPRVLLHQGSVEHMTAFARPALSNSGTTSSATPVNSAGGSRSNTDSPATMQTVVPTRKKVGFADSVEEQPACGPLDSGGSGSMSGLSGSVQPPRYDDAIADSPGGPTEVSTTRGVSPWRHHKSAIV